MHESTDRHRGNAKPQRGLILPRAGRFGAVALLLLLLVVAGCRASPVDRVELAFREWNEHVIPTGLRDQRNELRMRMDETRRKLREAESRGDADAHATHAETLNKLDLLQSELQRISPDDLKVGFDIVSVEETGPQAQVVTRINGNRVNQDRNGRLVLEPIPDEIALIVFILVRTEHGWQISRTLNGTLESDHSPNGTRPAVPRPSE